MIFISTPGTAPQPRQERAKGIHHCQIPAVVLTLKAFGKAIVAAPAHAWRPVWQVWQTRILLGVELFGNLAHGVLRLADLIHCLGMIAHAETAPARNPAKSKKQHTASAAAFGAQHPRPPATKAGSSFGVAYLGSHLAIADGGDA